ncbi:MAG TPA: glycosyltransferase family 4 protein, partial [Tepidisphaeraceae bacterium]|nr:glycosyltransferase family 4 protein [Tepidisphaeraceae bacterium]
TWKLPDFHRVVVAQWLVELAHKRYGCKDVQLINNGVDVDFFDAPPRKKQSGFTVGTMYSSLPFKGCDIAFKAIEQVRQRGRNVRVVAFGSEHIHESVTPTPGTQLEFRPTQERIREIYSSCDAWLFASRSEGFGLPILESMACRTPVIGTPAGAAPELINEGGGLLVEGENPDAMAKAIEQIAEMSEADWQRLSLSAYQTSRRHSWAASSQAFEQLLLKVAR